MYCELSLKSIVDIFVQKIFDFLFGIYFFNQDVDNFSKIIKSIGSFFRI